MNAGDAADQVIRQVDKMIKNTERASRDARLVKVISELACLTFSNFLFIWIYSVVLNFWLGGSIIKPAACIRWFVKKKARSGAINKDTYILL